jgi:nitroreductase/NAD-dependent dihydropyrimidine dehydrogenase PreA subunit
MALLQVNQEKCDSCNICVEECNLALIEMGDDKLPRQIAGGEEICQKCGHCVAVCPHGAVSLSMMTPEQCAPVRQDMFLSLEQAEHFFRSRRSVRLFKEQAVEKNVLEKLIATASYGATGANMQLLNWLIYSDSADIHKLGQICIDWMKEFREALPPCLLLNILNQSLKLWDEGRDSICCNASAVIVTYAPAGGTGSWDSTIALTQLSLAAPTLKLGTCWSGWIMFAAKFSPAMQEFLALPEGNACEGAMMVGYTKIEALLMPARNAPSIAWR